MMLRSVSSISCAMPSYRPPAEDPRSNRSDGTGSSQQARITKSRRRWSTAGGDYGENVVVRLEASNRSETGDLRPDQLVCWHGDRWFEAVEGFAGVNGDSLTRAAGGQGLQAGGGVADPTSPSRGADLCCASASADSRGRAGSYRGVGVVVVVVVVVVFFLLFFFFVRLVWFGCLDRFGSLDWFGGRQSG